MQFVVVGEGGGGLKAKITHLKYVTYSEPVALNDNSVVTQSSH